MNSLDKSLCCLNIDYSQLYWFYAVLVILEEMAGMKSSYIDYTRSSVLM